MRRATGTGNWVSGYRSFGGLTRPSSLRRCPRGRRRRECGSRAGGHWPQELRTGQKGRAPPLCTGLPSLPDGRSARNSTRHKPVRLQ
eukprot:4907455-Pyramimonas_sp.AAC.1